MPVEMAMWKDNLSTAEDMAAALNWRLPEPASVDVGPLPWLPGLPKTLRDHHLWGGYLAERSHLVIDLANQVGDLRQPSPRTARMGTTAGSRPTAGLLGEIAVWRAAVGVDPQDHRPTGAGHLQAASTLWQQNLTEPLPYAAAA